MCVPQVQVWKPSPQVVELEGMSLGGGRCDGICVLREDPEPPLLPLSPEEATAQRCHPHQEEALHPACRHRPQTQAREASVCR